ncbi:teichoic acid ABC transporter ATP-binding protein [Candidatus Magnetoovum chiemensis]|nr:teichoic acid ABC transporter ATP-binding protein [Candidatus Magnetoovum chiemensis]
MENTAIEVNNLAKTYKLYDKPSDRLRELFLRRPFHKMLNALDGVSFKLKKGTVLGIIGANGAGKSTLLKILSNTLKPSSGTFTVKGLTTSLLELGSGFHPEFTGIDNIFFYGSLLGMDRDYMKRKLNEIIEFSGLDAFIKYPVKTYSTGMYVRLAFSVATAVDPDVLIIDEALSVGDQYFQKKCIDRMSDFKRRKKTILFCSHDMYPIKSFCDETIWIDKGRIKMRGSSKDVADAYLGYEQMKAQIHKTQEISFERKKDGNFLFISEFTIKQTEAHEIELSFKALSIEPFLGHVGWAILRMDKLQVSFMTTKMQNLNPFLFHNDKTIHIHITDINLVEDTYQIYVGILDKDAIRPIAAEVTEFTIKTGCEIHNSLCHFNTTFDVKG